MPTRIFTLFIFFVLLIGCESSDIEDPSTAVSFYLSEDSYVVMYLVNHYDVRVIEYFKKEFSKGSQQVMIKMDDLAEGAYTLHMEVTGKYSKTFTQKTIPIILVK
ncbi:MAG: hypothetical protein J0L62_08405 [Bacteroidetes bacterium]|nr:hypothetical protein [Bacteroidota bacterium]